MKTKQRTLSSHKKGQTKKKQSIVKRQFTSPLRIKHTFKYVTLFVPPLLLLMCVFFRFSSFWIELKRQAKQEKHNQPVQVWLVVVVSGVSFHFIMVSPKWKFKKVIKTVKKPIKWNEIRHSKKEAFPLCWNEEKEIARSLTTLLARHFVTLKG